MTGILCALAGAGRRAVTLDDAPSSVVDVVIAPSNPNAYLIFENDGDLSQDFSVGGPAGLGRWLLQGSASDYDVNVVVNSGALQVGSAGTFNLGTTRTFGCDRSTNGTNQANVTFNLRPTGSGSNLASKTIAFEATREV